MIELLIKEFIKLKMGQDIENAEVSSCFEQTIDNPLHIEEFAKAGMDFHLKISVMMERRKWSLTGQIDKEIGREYGEDLSIEERGDIFEELCNRVIKKLVN